MLAFRVILLIIFLEPFWIFHFHFRLTLNHSFFILSPNMLYSYWILRLYMHNPKHTCVWVCLASVRHIILVINVFIAILILTSVCLWIYGLIALSSRLLGWSTKWSNNLLFGPKWLPNSRSQYNTESDFWFEMQAFVSPTSQIWLLSFVNPTRVLTLTKPKMATYEKSILKKFDL